MFVQRPITGDGTIIARVGSLSGIELLSEAGLMIRESLAAGSKHGFVALTGADTVGLKQRSSTNGNTAIVSEASGTAPVWLKLARRGSVLEASRSADGITWSPIGTASVTMAPTVFFGLVVTSGTALTQVTSTFSSVAASANQPPAVSLTAPANGATFTTPATINLAANASDGDGTVAEVEFFAGPTSIGTDTTSPFAATWSNVPVGTYTLTAVATDDSGATRTSAARSVTVIAPNQLPTVSLTAPAAGSTHTTGTPVTVSATAADSDGTVAQVQFFANTTPIGTDATAPYSVSWNPTTAGSYSLTAVATDNAGATRTSAARSVTVSSSNQSPTASLTAPANGATFNAPASITVSANASDPDGTVTSVEFFADSTTLIGSDLTAPYSVTWSNVPAGTYAITAVARDNDGATTVSGTRTITVNDPQMPDRAVFTPSSNHATAVDQYVLEIFPAGADPTAANPVATQNLGKPAVVNGECQVDVSQTIANLPPGNYIATITAFGSGGSAQSAASPQFSR